MKQYKMNLDEALNYYNRNNDKKLTKTELAKLANTTRSTLNNYERGNIPEFFDLYFSISEITGYPIEKLITQ